MDISTQTSVYGDKRYTIVGKAKTIVVYPSAVPGLWCVGDKEAPITEDLKLLPAMSLGMNLAMHEFTSGLQLNRAIAQAHKA